MLRELDQITKGKEEFISVYTPVRKTVEEFLRGGIKNRGRLVDRLRSIGNSAISSLVIGIGRKEYPRYEREISVMRQGPATPIHITAMTEGSLYPYSDTIEKSYIVVTVATDTDQNAPLAVLPPLQAFEKNKVRWEQFADIPQRLSEVLPLLPQ